jgi:zinc finger protein ubi-d4
MALKVSSPPPEVNINMPNIMKIEKLLSDSAYSELIEFSANFNTRLCVERKLRMPFLDPQTGVAQKHSNLYMKRTQRMPGLREGQIYSYPAVRWRNKTNSHKLSNRPFFRFRVNDTCSTAMATALSHTISQINSSSSATNNGSSSAASTSNGVDGGEASDFQTLIDQESNSMTGGADTDSKDSQEVPKDWYYDDMDVNDAVSEEQADSDFDYNINGYKRKKRGPVRKASRKAKESFEESSSSTNTRKRSGGGRSAGAGSRSRNKKGTRSTTKSSTSTGAKDKREPSFFDIEPPSFDKVQDDLKLSDHSADSFAYRKY